jgi:hypothetical protein
VHLYNVPAVPHDLGSASRRIRDLDELLDEYPDGDAPAWIAEEISALSTIVIAGYAALVAKSEQHT